MRLAAEIVEMVQNVIDATPFFTKVRAPSNRNTPILNGPNSHALALSRIDLPMRRSVRRP